MDNKTQAIIETYKAMLALNIPKPYIDLDVKFVYNFKNGCYPTKEFINDFLKEIQDAGL
jgi:hypothetical protein